MLTIETMIASTHSVADKWSSYERAALIALRSFIPDKFERLDVRASTYFSEAVRTPEQYRELYFVWLCESIVWTIREIRAGRPRDARRGQLQIAQYKGRVEAYADCLGTSGRLCWINGNLADAITAVTAELDR